MAWHRLEAGARTGDGSLSLVAVNMDRSDRMYQFLRRRGISEVVIKEMITEKIDQATVLLMDESALEKFIPALGDRVALRNHCETGTNQSGGTRKLKLLDKLRKKMKLTNSANSLEECSDEDRPENKNRRSNLVGNKNAVRKTRRIELGWIHNGRQVRTKLGGGTRKLVVEKNLKYEGLLKLGKELFFPKGKSRKGQEHDFTFKIWDFKENEIDHDITVGEIYETAKFNIVRFYLSSSEREQTESFSSEEQTGPEQSNPQPCEDNDSDCFEVNEHAPSDGQSDEEVQIGPVVDPDYDSEDTFEVDREQPVPHLSLSESEEELSLPTREEPQPVTVPLPQQSPRVMKLHRVNVLKDMLNVFKDATILDASLQVTFVDEAGVDASGVTRDAYAAFWESFFQNCSEGEVERVPSLVPDYGKDEWEAVGRILLKGFKDLSYFPIQFSLAFTVCLVHGECRVTTEMLIESFLRFLTPFEKDTISAALDGAAYEDDELLDILSRMGSHTVPKPDALKDTIEQIAHKQLIQEPRYALEMMANSAQCFLRKALPSVSEVKALYEAKTPTPRGIIMMLKAEERQVAHSKTLQFLKLFIKSLDQGKLQKFLRFITGADVICVDQIEVEFTDLRGLERRPVAHTCGPLLQVPCTYRTYAEFRREFLCILEGQCFKMDIL